MQISVVLSTQNGEQPLLDHLHSVLEQTHLPDELIVIGDASQDGTLALLHYFRQIASFPITVKQHGNPAGTAFNVADAIPHCSGDVIVLANQNDVWYEDKLATIVDVFKQEKDVGLIFSDAELLLNNSYPLSYTLWDLLHFGRAKQDLVLQGTALDILLGRPTILKGAFAFRKQYSSIVLPIPAEWDHNEWIGLNLALITRLYPISKSLVTHSIQLVDQSITKTINLWKGSPSDPGFYQRRAAQYRLLLKHITQFAGISAGDRKQLAETISHLQFRGNLPHQRYARLIPVATHLHRYFTYRDGIPTMLHDLLSVHSEE